MTTRQAAALIGCSPSHVRWLVATGRVRATRLSDPTQNQHGYRLSIERRSAERYRDTEQSRGWPRGQART